MIATTDRTRANRARTGSDAARERGSVTPLIIGFTIILMLLVTMVVDASAVFIYKRQLASAADGAALAAANGVSAAAIYQGGLGDDVELSQRLAERKVGQYVRENHLAGEFENLSYRTVVSGSDVTVSFRATTDLPFVNEVSGDLGSAIPVESEASATAFTEG